MTYITSILILPLVFVLLCAGFGALAQRAAGVQTRLDLLLPSGLALLLVVGYLVAWIGLPPAIKVIAIVAGAIAGLVLLVRDRPAFSRDHVALPAAAAFVAGGFVIAPIVFHGNATLAGYLLDTTAGIHMYAGDWILQHGLDFSSTTGPNAGEGMLHMFYAANPYPAGAQFLLAVLGALTATSQLWLYTAFIATLVATGAIALFGLVRAIGLGPKQSLLAAVLASVPALVYGYALQGSIKEIAFIPLLALLGWLLVDEELVPTPRALAVLGGIVSGAAFSVIGFSAIAWIGCFSLALVVAHARRSDEGERLKAFLVAAALLALGVIVASLPSVAEIQANIKLASGLSQTNAALAADPGNLLQPIRKFQALGTWLSPSHRSDPVHLLKPTFILLGVSAALFLAGALSLLRQRNWRVIAWMTIIGFVWIVLTSRGTMWIDAKLVMLSSATVVIIVIVGALTLRQSTLDAPQTSNGWPIVALALAGVTLGVFASDGQLYLNYGILPTERYKELESINSAYAGKGPALSPEFDEYSLFVLRDVKLTMPGSAARLAVTGTFRDGQPVPYGRSVDVDELPTVDHARAPLVIQRSGPWRSNPGPWFKLDRKGTYADVWARTGKRIHVAEYLPLSSGTSVGKLHCADAARLKAKALARNSSLIAGVPTAAVDAIDLRSLKPFGGWSVINNEVAAQLELHPSSEGGIKFNVDVKPGQLLWWRGRIDRDVKVAIDGREAGTFERMVGGPGNVLAPVSLPVGRHEVTLTRGGGKLAPGSRNGSAIEALALAPSAPPVARDVTRQSLASLCSRQLDWIAVAKR